MTNFQGQPFDSDDFNSANLDSSWTVFNPLGDGSLALTGTDSEDAYLELSVPSGVSHNLWKTNKNALRVMQPATDDDFQLEVKFASEPVEKYQIQGILVEQDDSNWLRFDTHHNGSSLKVFAASTTNNSSVRRVNLGVASQEASYLRVTREDSTWTTEYSADGLNWNNAGSFDRELNVSSVGTFAGNAGNRPSFTSQVDYFFNNAHPIIPEDLNADKPVIDLWYGQEQTFGHLGQPQTWINILGNVDDLDGVASLSYSLNGGSSIPLSIGQNGGTRRLAKQGDFNIDIAYADLDGSSVDDLVVISASDSLGNTSTETVTINYEAGNIWSDNYSIDWNSVAEIQDVSQIVDGKWILEEDSVRTAEPGYDRIIAIGDVSWTDYEATVPITIEKKNKGKSKGGMGLGVRWTGHTDNPIAGTQPKSGWQPLGAIGWYYDNKLAISTTNTRGNVQDTSGRELEEGVTYNFKMRSETLEDGSLYSLKVWEEDVVEPENWDLQYQEDLSRPLNGSLFLISHRYDTSFGDVDVRPIIVNEPPIAVDDTANVETSGSITIDVLANDSDPDGSLDPSSVTIVDLPSQGTVDVNPSDGTITYSHTGSTEGTDSFTYTVSDDEAAVSHPATVNLTIEEPSGSIFRSDDFNNANLDSSWTVFNPLGDGSLALTGTDSEDAYLELSVPSGVSHNLWKTNKNALRVMQPATDDDFQLEVKFASEPVEKYQIQGILVEQDESNWLRFDTHHNGSSLKVFAASTTNNSSVRRVNLGVASQEASYLRVTREDSTWTTEYSADGLNWNNAGSFDRELNVSSVGTFAGNAGNRPSFTSQVDYFFNNAHPIIPEDGLITAQL